MSIETIDDILEELADKLGIYGAHDDEENPDADYVAVGFAGPAIQHHELRPR